MRDFFKDNMLGALASAWGVITHVGSLASGDFFSRGAFDAGRTAIFYANTFENAAT